MCNLYSLNRPQDEIRRWFDVSHDSAGNLPPKPGIFPDQMAPVVLAGKEGRELTMMRWGIPGPKAYGEHPVTNVRNVKSPHWRPWLKPEFRCLVPVSSFSEYADTKPRKTPVWFALDDDRPLFAFAGIWRPWTGVRGTKKENPDRVEEEHRL
ncbi:MULTISPECIES: SOS response-associated peptidase, partial [unclassified Methylobacterium]